MKIAFFTEIPLDGQKFPREHPNMRTEFAWMVALDADHYNIHSDNVNGQYDLGVVIIPKKNPSFDLNKIRAHCTRVCSMQEGPHWYFQDYPLAQQVWFYNTLMEMDFMFVHNELDKKYFEGLTRKNCIVMPSLMIEDAINNLEQVERSGTMIGGNFCNWYGGFDSYVSAQIFREQIYVPTMGRKIDGEEEMPNLIHLPYMDWINWIAELNKRKYGIHLMRTHAAGTFALNCAYLGIPCIGYEGLDTQMICHPDLTVKVGDISTVNSLAIKLRDDKGFYDQCSEMAKFMYAENYHEDKYKQKILEKINV